MRLCVRSLLPVPAVGALIFLAVPGNAAAQGFTAEQSAALRAEAVSLKADLIDGNYRLGFQRAVELGLLVSGSEKAKEASERVANMQGGPMPPALKAPGSTASLVPVADRLVQAIDAGDLAAAKELISGLTRSIGDVHRAELKRASAKPVSAGDPVQGGSSTDGNVDELKDLQIYFDLTKSLHDALSLTGRSFPKPATQTPKPEQALTKSSSATPGSGFSLRS